jgi:hypothetical protein
MPVVAVVATAVAMLRGACVVCGKRGCNRIPLTVAQSQAQVSMWTILKSPMLASADFSNVSQQLIDVLSNNEVLAVSDDPLGEEVGFLSQMAWVLRSVQFAALQRNISTSFSFCCTSRHLYILTGTNIILF